jgi:dienelactone hydrolase
MDNIHRAAWSPVAARLLALVAPAAAGSAEVAVEVTGGGKPVTPRAQLHVPKGAGPSPALVFPHGCGGQGGVQDAWADELTPQRAHPAEGVLEFVVYPGASHGFVGARERVREFLAKYLKGESQ